MNCISVLVRSKWSVSQYSDTPHFAIGRKVIVNRFVLCGAVIPKSDRVFLPFESATKLGLDHMVIEEVENSISFPFGHTHDLTSE